MSAQTFQIATVFPRRRLPVPSSYLIIIYLATPERLEEYGGEITLTVTAPSGAQTTVSTADGIERVGPGYYQALLHIKEVGKHTYEVVVGADVVRGEFVGVKP